MPNPTPSRSNPPIYLLLGQITRPHGVRGELRLKILTDYPERISKLKQVYIGKHAYDEQAKPYDVAGVRVHQDFGLIRLKEVPDRDTAERLRELYIMVQRENAVPLEDDEFYVYELIGLRVETPEGYLLGTLTDVMETGANDVYIIDSPEYGEVLFPAIDDTIVDHDIEGGVVIVNIPDGLLPDKKA